MHIGKASYTEDIRRDTESTLSEKVVKGSFWIFSLRITNRVLGLLRTVILARLLLPEHFGVLGIAALTISTIETFSQPGLGTALVQKKDDIQDYLDTAWTASVIRSILILALLLLVAPSVAYFFDTKQAQIVLQVLAVTVLIAGCRNIGVIYFQKELNFKKQYIYDATITLGNIAVAIPAAYILRNVWALVLGAIAGSLTRFFMSYVLQAYRPRLKFEREKIKVLFGYGRWVLGSSILVFLVTQGDDIFLGKLFGATALGFYQMAYMISNLPTTDITQAISHVTFPAYSKIQNEIPRLKDAYLKVVQCIIFIAAPLAGGLFILSPEFVEFVLSEKWLPTIPLIKILVWAGFTSAVMNSTLPVFNAAGVPKIQTRWQLRRLVFLAVSIYPLAVIWDLSGIALSVLLSTLITAVGLIYETNKILQYSLIRFVKGAIIPCTSVLMAMGVVIWAKKVISFDNILEFVILFTVGILVYLPSVFLLDKLFKHNMGKIIKESIALLRIRTS